MHRPRAGTASGSPWLRRPEGREPGRFILQPSGSAGDALGGTGAGRWEMGLLFPPPKKKPNSKTNKRQVRL